MTEIVTVTPAKPGDGDPRYSGLAGVYYSDNEHELCIYFAVTLRTVLDPATSKLVRGTMQHAIAIMQDMCDAHHNKLIEIDPSCFWSEKPAVDEFDQRPPEERQEKSRKTSESPANRRDGNFAGKETAYSITKLVSEKGEYYSLRFNLGNGQPAKNPTTISTKQAVTMLETELIAHGDDPANWPIGKPQEINIEFAWQNGKDIPGQPGKKYRDYQYFIVLDNEDGGDIPF